MVGGNTRFRLKTRRLVLGSEGSRVLKLRTTKSQRRVLCKRHGRLVFELLATSGTYGAVPLTVRVRF